MPQKCKEVNDDHSKFADLRRLRRTDFAISFSEPDQSEFKKNQTDLQI